MLWRTAYDSWASLSTHADRQGVNISFTVCVCLFVCLFVLCVCTVTDFFAEDKASGVTFCTAVYRRPRQGVSNFCELCCPQKPKIGRIGQRTGHAHWHVNITVEMRRSWNISRRVDVRSACVDIGHSLPHWRTCVSTGLLQMCARIVRVFVPSQIAA